MSEDIDPESTIPWPGFVDILSTVIIVFVFFMMMTSVIIFVLSDQAKKAAVESAVKAKTEDKQASAKTAPNNNLAPDVNNLLAEKEALQQEVNRLTQLKNVLSESNEQKTTRAGNEIVVAYGDMGSTIVPETTDTIKSALPFDGHATIHALIPAGRDFGSIREIALNRALNIRNILLQNGMTSDHIAIRISQPEAQATAQINPAQQPKLADQYGSVKITFEK